VNIDRKDPRILCFPITLLLVFCLLAGFAYAQPVPVTGTLKTAVPVPLVLNGKQVGSTTLPAGTKVTVVQESAGKTLVKAAIGETWVASDVLDVAPSEPAATAPEAPAQTAVTAPTSQAEVPAAPAAAKKKALIWGTFLSETVYTGKEALEKAGYTVDIVSPTGWIQRMQYGVATDEKQNGIPTVTAASLPTAAKDYALVWVAYTDTSKEAVEAINQMNRDKKAVVLEDYPSAAVQAVLSNNPEKVEQIVVETKRKTECGQIGRVLYYGWGVPNLTNKQEKALIEAQRQIYKDNPGIQPLEMLKVLKPQEDAAYVEARRNRPASEVEKINTFLTKDIVQAANQAAQ
jgi:hypothetical protein